MPCGMSVSSRLMAIAFLALPVLGQVNTSAATTDVVMPTTYESGHFYATPVLDNGKAMRMLLDTGGGPQPGYWINQIQADAMSLTADDSCEMDGQTFALAHPRFRPGEGMPVFPGPCHGVIILPADAGTEASGQLVPFYFSHGVWTYDYPGRKVTLRANGSLPPGNAHKTRLGFRVSPSGFVFGWPRIVLTVDGQALDMLLDTGATAHPTPEGLKASGISTTSEGIGVTSYITKSTMDAWRKKHPDWTVIEQGDDLNPRKVSPIIRVPKVRIAGWEVGPVWFTERPDSAFHDMMASMMDRPPEGAVGANIFEHFRMTIDYPHRNAWFECLVGCASTSSARP